MAENVTYSTPQLVTIEGQKYEVRTSTQWSGGSGTINTSSPINTKVQYKPGPTLSNPLPQFIDLAERTDNKSVNNGWSFRPLAGPGFKQELVKTGPTSLSSQLDTATQKAVAKDANVPLTTAQQALSKVTPSKANQALSAPNQNPNAPVGAPAGAGESTPEEKVDLTSSQNNLDNLAISDSEKTRKVSEYPNSDNLRYPIDLKADNQDCIKFTMLEYAPSKLYLQGISKGDPLSERSTTQNRTRGSTVTLPIQPNISDTNTVNWGSNEMNAAELIAASAALGTITGGAEGAGEAVQAASSLLQGASEDLKKTAAAAMAERAAGTKGLLTRVTGGIINPNMELLFNGPQLRSFTFTFTMSAREPKESLVIRNIIRFFKQGMSVKRASTGLFLKSPHTFEIKYMSKNKEHTWINKIKECALTSCTVSYTPAGNYATYDDGAMTQYEMSLTFGELEPIYDDDYGKGSTSFDTEIGY